MAGAHAVSASVNELPRLLYIGDVSVADSVAGEALLYRLLQYYPQDRLALVCGIRPDMRRLPGVAYHEWAPAFPGLLHSRVAEEYVLWRAWRYYEVPPAISHIATMFKPQAILTISHVSGWLAAWQLARHRGVPLHLIAHDDFVYASRFPAWSRPWAERKFGEAYRFASGRFCISEAMEESYRMRFGVGADILYPTHKGSRDLSSVSPRVDRADRQMTFAYGGSLNSAADIDMVVRFAKAAAARGHRLMAFTPQCAILAAAAEADGASIDTRAPVHSDELLERLRVDADCLFLPQSMAAGDRGSVATAFSTKWADYATVGLPVLVWAPPQSSSARFVTTHPGCAELVTGPDVNDLLPAFEALERSPGHRRRLAEAILAAARTVFSPGAAWERFRAALAAPPVTA